MELTDRIRAALDETERIARDACHGGTGDWSQRDPEREPGRIEDETGEPVVFDEGSPSWRQARYIVRHDPASVLRMVAAHRKLLDAYERADREAGTGISPEGSYANGMEFAVRLIAEAYGVEA